MKQYAIGILSILATVASFYFVFHLPLSVSIGIAVMLLLHELGHVVALWQLGKKVKGIYFLPFVGAAVAPNEEFRSTNELSIFKISGPLAGTLSVWASIILYLWLDDSLFVKLAAFGGVINLINMIPMVPLDGHGVLVGVHRNMRYIGLAMLLIFGVIVLQSFALVLFFFIVYLLFSYDDTIQPTGFQIREVVLAAACFFALVFLVLTSRVDRISGITFLALSVWAIFAYLRWTLHPEYKKLQTATERSPLTKTEKRDWAIRWLGLTTVLALTTAPAYIYAFF